MHISVLYQEVLDGLQPVADGLYIDGTLGFGGHTLGLLKAASPNGRVLAFDRDQNAITEASRRLGEMGVLTRAHIVHASFAEMGRVAPANGFAKVDGIILDLGLSSMQLDNRTRGFSFRYDAPLDMRFDETQNVTAAELVNGLSADQLSDIFWQYGEERRSRFFARKIVENRPINTTLQLANLIASHSKRKQRTHPATQIFQALRIAVNDELAALEKGLPAAIELLKPGGRVAVISFHSLEDRFVKQTFRALSTDCICPPEQPICTCDHEAIISLPRRKATQPTSAEIAANPRSRSARLRVAEKRVAEKRVGK
jgi:16S rRNA (cytosine1402-N4)-methyltransferase